LPSERPHMIKSALTKHIPANPEIIISMQNSLNSGYLSKYKTIFVFPHAVNEKRAFPKTRQLDWSGFWNFLKNKKLEKNISNPVWADYVVLDIKKSWFIVDRGCHWIQGTCLKGQNQFTSEFSDLVEKAVANFDTVYENDGFMILKNRSYNQSN